MEKMTSAEFEREAMIPPLSNADLCDVLNGLIQTCKDSEMGFEQAARDVESSSLKSVFWRLATQRAELAGELQSWVLRLGGVPGAGGTLGGAIRRGWAEVRSVVARRSEESILADCRRAEDLTFAHYKDACDRELPADLRAVLNRQFDAIAEARADIAGL